MKTKSFPFLLLIAALWTGFTLGCATSSQNSEFVKTINFAPLDTFVYKHTLVSDFDMNDSERRLLENLSESVLSRELAARDFAPAEAGGQGDFQVVTKWRKSLTTNPGLFQPVDGPLETMHRQDRPGNNMMVRYSLVVEIYESASGHLFWRSELPNIFEAIQLTEERVVAALERAIRNFPSRVEKDPNLPSIQ